MDNSPNRVVKLAYLYRFATFFSIATANRTQVRNALGYLVDVLSPEQIMEIQKLYMMAAGEWDSETTLQAKRFALDELDGLTDNILEEYSDHPDIQKIYNNLDIINTNAEQEIEDGTIEDQMTESVDKTVSNVGYQPGQEIAQKGEGILSRDPEQKKEYDRSYRKEKRTNPIYRENFLSKEKAYDKVRYQKDNAKIVNLIKQHKFQTIKLLMSKGLSKEEAEKKFREDIENNLTDRVKNENITEEEFRNNLLNLKSEEIDKYYKNLVNSNKKTPLTPSEKMALMRARKIYINKYLENNPGTSVEEMKEKVKGMSVNELKQAIQELAA